MKNSVLARVLETTMACDEDDVTRLYRLLNPTTREEMGIVYNETIGYNPVTYFDKREAEDYFNILMLDAPQSVRASLQNKRDEIVEAVIEHKENLSHDYIISLLNLEIAKVTGWKNKKYPLINIEEEFISVDEDDDDFDISDDEEGDLLDDDGYDSDDFE